MSDVPVRQALAYFKLPAEDRETQFHMLCPFHEDTAPSLDIDTEIGYWNCLGCGAKGDFIDFVARLDGGNRLKAMQLIHRLKKMPEGDIPGLITQGRRRVNHGNMDADTLRRIWRGFHRVNWHTISLKYPAARYLLEQRRFKRDTLEAFDMRLTEKPDYPIVMPVRQLDRMVGYAYRRIDKVDTKKYLYNSGFQALKSVGYYKVGSGPCLIVEGLLDLMKAAQFGAKHCAAILRWNISEEQAMWLQAQGVREVISGLDNTPSGKEGTSMLRDWFMTHRFQFPGSYRKDIADLNQFEFNMGMVDTLGLG